VSQLLNDWLDQILPIDQKVRRKNGRLEPIALKSVVRFKILRTAGHENPHDFFGKEVLARKTS